MKRRRNWKRLFIKPFVLSHRPGEGRDHSKYERWKSEALRQAQAERIFDCKGPRQPAKSRAACFAIGGLVLAACEPVQTRSEAAYDAGETCRSVTITDTDGERVVGIEDLAIDRARGLAYLSAYDRRAVAEELETQAGPRTTGGIYVLDLAETIGAEATVERLAVPQTDAEIARPHGIALNARPGGSRLAAIDRHYERREGRWHLTPRLVQAKLSKNGRRVISAKARPLPQILCSPNDLTFVGKDLLVTNDRGHCAGIARVWEDIIGGAGGRLVRLSETEAETVVMDIPFANGVARMPAAPRRMRLVLAATRAGGLFFFPADVQDRPARKASTFLELDAAPDNITRSSDGTLYVAAHPALPVYALFRSGLAGVERAPSAVYAVSMEDTGRPQARKLVADPAGSVISGATVAARFEDRLLIGAAYDDHLAVCDLRSLDAAQPESEAL